MEVRVHMRRTCIFALAVALSLGAASVRAATFYVDPTHGSPSGDGSEANPWRTIEEDVAQRLSPLDGGVDGNTEPLSYLALAHHFHHGFGTKCSIFFTPHDFAGKPADLVAGGGRIRFELTIVTGEDGFARHERMVRHKLPRG